jgi:hypothetical protein
MARLSWAAAWATLALLADAALVTMPEVRSVVTGTAGGGVSPLHTTQQSDQDFVLSDSEGAILWAAVPWSAETGDCSCDTACDPPTGCRLCPSKNSRLGKNYGRTQDPPLCFSGHSSEEGGRQTLRIFAGVWGRVVR